VSLSILCGSSSFTPFQRTSLSHTHIYINITHTPTYTHTTSPLRKRRKSYIGPMNRSLQIWVRTLGLTVAFFDIMDYGLKIYQKWSRGSTSIVDTLFKKRKKKIAWKGGGEGSFHVQTCSDLLNAFLFDLKKESDLCLYALIYLFRTLVYKRSSNSNQVLAATSWVPA